MKLDLSSPRDWQPFEDLCRDLWAELWHDSNAQKHGRQGQKQRCVGVFGQPDGGTDWEGVQCKTLPTPAHPRGDRARGGRGPGVQAPAPTADRRYHGKA